jgi:LPXTG-motif cell wall-anchored protein
MRFVVVAGLVGLALLCLAMAWQNYGIQTAHFDADPTAPARAGTTSAGGLNAEGVRWLIAAGVALVAAIAVTLRRRKR